MKKRGRVQEIGTEQVCYRSTKATANEAELIVIKS